MLRLSRCTRMVQLLSCSVLESPCTRGGQCLSATLVLRRSSASEPYGVAFRRRHGVPYITNLPASVVSSSVVLQHLFPEGEVPRSAEVKMVSLNGDVVDDVSGKRHLQEGTDLTLHLTTNSMSAVALHEKESPVEGTWNKEAVDEGEINVEMPTVKTGRRGRPRKAPQESAGESVVPGDDDQLPTSAPKGKRGRPRKVKETETSDASPGRIRKSSKKRMASKGAGSDSRTEARDEIEVDDDVWMTRDSAAASKRSEGGGRRGRKPRSVVESESSQEITSPEEDRTLDEVSL